MLGLVVRSRRNGFGSAPARAAASGRRHVPGAARPVTQQRRCPPQRRAPPLPAARHGTSVPRPPRTAAGAASQELGAAAAAAMAENAAAAAGLENHRIKSFKNKGRDVEVSAGPCAPRPPSRLPRPGPAGRGRQKNASGF